MVILTAIVQSVLIGMTVYLGFKVVESLKDRD